MGHYSFFLAEVIVVESAGFVSSGGHLLDLRCFRVREMRKGFSTKVCLRLKDTLFVS